MRISIIGTGYVGLPTAIGLAKKGNHNIILVGRKKEKIDLINKGKSPIYEKGMNTLLNELVKKKKIMSTTNLSFALNNSEVTMIAVGTPSREDGSIDLSQLETISKQLGDELKNKNEYHLFILKSTVVPGTTEEIMIPLLEKHSGKKTGKDFGACMNPEFLREGIALEDVFKPDRIVIGEYDKKSGDLSEKIYKNFEVPKLRTNLKTAEMIKYASNSLLATKISFINEIGNLCKKLGIDVNEVSKGMGLDHRISPKFLNAGIGFGGSCFPKDVKAIRAKAKELNVETKILNSVIEVNDKQPSKLLEHVSNTKIGLLGLAFKPQTDDVREARSVIIIKKLLEDGKEIYVYDPKATENVKRMFKDKINYCKSAEECIEKSDDILLITEWDEFKSLNPNLFKGKRVIDGRGILKHLKKDNMDYEGVCW